MKQLSLRFSRYLSLSLDFHEFLKTVRPYLGNPTAWVVSFWASSLALGCNCSWEMVRVALDFFASNGLVNGWIQGKIYSVYMCIYRIPWSSMVFTCFLPSNMADSNPSLHFRKRHAPPVISGGSRGLSGATLGWSWAGKIDGVESCNANCPNRFWEVWQFQKTTLGYSQ